MQSQNFKPRDPKIPLDIDINNIAYNEAHDEDLEFYKLTEIIEALTNLPFADSRIVGIWEDELDKNEGDVRNIIYRIQ